MTIQTLRTTSLMAALLGALGLLSAVTVDAESERPVIGHRINATLDPESGRLQAQDQLTVPADRRRWDLILHRGLEPKVTSGNAAIRSLGSEGHLEHLRLSLTGTGPVTIAYGGIIRHDLDRVQQGMGRQRQTSVGTVNRDGVFLDGSSGWYPRIPGSLQRFDLRVVLPQGWQAVSQGQGPGDGGTWSEQHPQDDIYLIAAPFERYRRANPRTGVESQVWLRRPDPALAHRYLDATDDYIAVYSDLIGPYPYAKFALVENFWETGYGMPSFTLLGPRVIRLPFIIHTSYPHEILHNWWGNGVYVDYAAGNWSEGLTAYLADHLIKERAGQGAAYRRDALKSYADYVRDGEDFPLVDFRGRHGSASQAIGYGKAAMVFHMLRRMLGDPSFRAALQRFYRDHRFQITGWSALREAFEASGGRDLGGFFDAWINRIGAPMLSLSSVRQEAVTDGHRVSGRITQIQPEAPFPMLVPVVVQDTDGVLHVNHVEMTDVDADFSIETPTQAVRVSVDPAFDTFRALTPGESPVSLSSLFGAAEGTIVLPANADPERLAAYRELAQAWTRDYGGWRIILDSELTELPNSGAIWLLGWDNRYASRIAAHGGGDELDLAGGALTLSGGVYARADTSLVLTSGETDRPLGWLAASTPAAIPGLARKLPHYGKYGYLAFRGSAPDNIAKGQWPGGDSALVHWLVQGRRAPLRWNRLPLIAPETNAK